MATTVRAIELMLPGSYGKEQISNDGMQNLALGISGAAVIALTNVDHTLTTDNQGEAMRFVQILTGALTANVNVIVPAESRVYVADNRTTGAFTVTFKTAAGGGVAVDQGARTLIYCDGTTVYPVASGTGGGGGSGAPTDATYLVQSPHALLTGERAVTDTPTVIWDFATPGAAMAQIPDGAVSYAKVQDVTAKRLLGRYDPVTGDMQEITPGSGLSLSDSGLLDIVGGGGPSQPLDATLTALAALPTGADQLPYFTGTDLASQTPLSPLARTLLDDTTQGAMQGTLGLVPGTHVQAFDATLSALAGVTTGADTLAFFTGVDTASSTPFSPLARALLDDTTQAEMQATIGVTGGGGGSYTDEQAQDAVGAILTDSATLDFTYDDTTPSITGIVKDASITEAKLLLTDVTTQNASTTAHGLLRKLSGTATQYLDGTGAWSTPAGGGGGEWTRVVGAAGSTARTGLLAFWRMEEASGNRVDSVSAQALVPTGAPGSAAGKTGQAVSFDTGAGKYLAAADSATLSVGANQDFTVAAWIYFQATPSGAKGIIGKGNASVSYNNCEYLLGTSGTSLLWYVRSANLNAGITLAAGTWYFVVAWYDAAADFQYIQVNNGTPAQFANATGSFDSADPVEVGRQPLYTGSAAFNGLIDNVMFWKRVLTAGERTELYNSGNGLDYSALFPAATVLRPTVSTDSVLAGATTLTASEPLESAGGLKLGTSTGTVDGIVRWTGTDMEVRKGGVWTSLSTTSFLLLSDSPDAYTGNALKLLRVNAAANAVEFGDVLGTMATQNANAVAISGGTAQLTQATVGPRSLNATYILDVGGQARATAFVVQDAGQDNAAFACALNAGSNRYCVQGAGTAPSYFGGTVQVVGLTTLSRAHIGNASGAPSNNKVLIPHSKATEDALVIIPTDSDTGPGNAILFRNGAGAVVGSIYTSGSGTTYGTTSDMRLKHNIQPLTNVLDCIRALRPIAHLWNADGSYGEGFLAHELMQQVPLAVTGEPDEVNPDGSVKPQQVDHSKLVPRLTAGLQAALAQIDALTARVATLEAALGA